MPASWGDIVITGSGVIAPLGHDPATLLNAICAQQSGLSTVARFDTEAFPCTVAAPVTDFNARTYVKSRRNLKLMSPAVRFGMAAVSLAHAQARPSEALDPERFGLFVGAGAAFGETRDLLPAIEAGFDGDRFDLPRFAVDGTRLISPLWLLKGLSNNVLGFATAEHDARGVNQNYCNSGVGGLQAIGEAAWALVEGKADYIVAGGADSAIDISHFTGFGRLRMLTRQSGADAMRPFCVGRDGFAPSEGAAFFALETAHHARLRGAPVLARIAGYGNACAAHALPSCDPETIAAAGRAALDRAGWDRVDLVFCHGNSSVVFDAAEAAGFALLFGDKCPPITGVKGHIGHAIAASGPISLACAIEAARTGRAPAFPGHGEVDPAFAHLDLVRGAPREMPISRVLVHAAGLGGQTTFIALEVTA